MNLEELKQLVIEALEDVKATDICVLDVAQLTSVTSCMIIASGNSSRQTRALADNVQKKLKERGVRIQGVEGEQEGEWVLVDLGDIIVHIMLPTTRAYYNLEQLWGAAENRRLGARSSA